jgi:PAS domain S-box-containing protein
MSNVPPPFISALAHHAADPFRLLVQSVVDYAIYMVDPGGRIASWNPGAERIYGYRAEEIIGQPFSAVFSPGDLTDGRPNALWQQALDSGHIDFECMRMRKDRSEFFAIVSVSVLNDHLGNHSGFSVVTRDLTERKAAEETIRKERELADAILASLPGIYYIYDEQRRFLRWNARFQSVSGYSAEEMERLHPLDLFSPRDRALVEGCIATVFESGSCEVEAAFLTKDGQELPYFFNGVRTIVAGRPCLLGMGIDLGSLESARAELRRTAALLRAVIEAIPDALFVKDRAGKYLLFNPAASTYVGKPEAEVLGHDDTSLFDPESARVAMEHDRRVMEREEADSDEEELTAAGVTRTYLATKTPFRDAEGRVIGVLGLSRDITEQKRAAQELHQREILLRIAGRVARLGGWSFDLLTNTLVWSEEIREIHEEPVGHQPSLVDALHYYPEESRAMVAEHVEGCARDGTPFDFEAELITAKGRRIWTRSIGEAVRDESGRIVRMQGAFQDITDLKQAERDRLQLAHRLATTLESMNEGFFTLDEEWRFTYVNTEGQRLIQRGRDDLLGRTIWESFPETLGIAFEQSYRRARDEGVTVDFQEYFPPLDTWFGVRAHPTESGLAVYFRDVTASHKAEEALRASQEQQRALTEQLESERSRLVAAQAVAKVGSWETNLATQEVVWSAESFRIFDQDPASFQPTHPRFLALVHPEDREAVARAFDDSLVLRTPQRIEHRILLARGVVKFVEERWQVVCDGAGQPVRVIGTCQDVSERRHLEAQFRQSQKMEAVGRLAGGVAHDFNNLLTVISGYSELLLAAPSAATEMHDAAAAIHDAGERAAALTRQLLGFSRQTLVQPKVVDLNDVVAQTSAMLRRLIGEDILFATVLAPSLSRVKVDPGQLDQLLMNLAVNARDAMPTGGKLTIETRDVMLGEDYAATHLDCTPGPHVMLAMSDTGTGMSAETLQQIFEPFFTTKEVGKGTGLGLAMVFGIVQQSGGSIHVYSEPGRGSTFKVYFPAVTEALSVEVPTEKPSDLHGSETILLVEDEDAVRRLALRSLTMYGYRVLAATDGGDALRVVAAHVGSIDLILTDVVMPNVSGPDLVRELGKSYPGVKVLFMSGYTDDAVVRHGLIETDMAFIQKPYTPVGLVRKVRSVLDTG